MHVSLSTDIHTSHEFLCCTCSVLQYSSLCNTALVTVVVASSGHYFMSFYSHHYYGCRLLFFVVLILNESSWVHSIYLHEQNYNSDSHVL